MKILLPAAAKSGENQGDLAFILLCPHSFRRQFDTAESRAA
jgi:hypothetical protein